MRHLFGKTLGTLLQFGVGRVDRLYHLLMPHLVLVIVLNGRIHGVETRGLPHDDHDEELDRTWLEHQVRGATRDFVPTAITTGPDGAYYFGHLNGLSVLQNSSKVYRMERGGTPEVFLENFTWIVALAFDPSGNLYVLQFTDGPTQASGGSVTRIAPDGTREKLVGGLQRATGLAVGPDGAIYVSMTQGQNYRADGEVRRYVIP